MNTTHKFIHGDARNTLINPGSADLVVTSPPYPMVAMWDNCFSDWQDWIGASFKDGRLDIAYKLIHHELDHVWRNLFYVLKPGGFVCINIGDATRTLESGFRIFNNHARIIGGMVEAGFTSQEEYLELLVPNEIQVLRNGSELLVSHVSAKFNDCFKKKIPS